MSITQFDHVAIPIEQVDAMLRFYEALGFRTESHPPLHSVHFGDNKINMHAPELWRNERFTLRGPTAQPGCGDFCFVWSSSVHDLTNHLQACGATPIEGPVERVGGRESGTTKGTSVYVRDPDGNLLEFIVYEN